MQFFGADLIKAAFSYLPFPSASPTMQVSAVEQRPVLFQSHIPGVDGPFFGLQIIVKHIGNASVLAAVDSVYKSAEVCLQEHCLDITIERKDCFHPGVENNYKATLTMESKGSMQDAEIKRIITKVFLQCASSGTPKKSDFYECAYQRLWSEKDFHRVNMQFR